MDSPRLLLQTDLAKLYHGSPRKNRQSILAQGLLADPPHRRSKNQQPGVYLSVRPEIARGLGQGNWDIWEVDIQGIGVQLIGNVAYCPIDIPSERCRLWENQ